MPSLLSEFDLRRKDWGARTAVRRRNRGVPVRLEVHHTASPSLASTTGKPFAEILRNIQDYHMDTKGWNDIFYNGFVDRDGTLAEGRPDLATPGSFALCFLGNFEDEQPTPQQLATLKRLEATFDEPIDTHTWRAAGTKYASACPGDNMIALVTALNTQETSDMDTPTYVNRLYVMLGRQPDEGGFNFWVEQIDSDGWEPIEVLVEFLTVKFAADKVAERNDSPVSGITAAQAVDLFYQELAEIAER